MRIIFLYVHLSFLAIAMGGIVLADRSALAWLRGKVEVVSHRALFNAHWVVTIGLSGLILSGLYLFWPQRNFLLMQPLFWIKMVLVAALIINSFFIEELMHMAKNYTFASLTARQKLPLFISGGVSVLSWLGAAIVAYLLFGWLF